MQPVSGRAGFRTGRLDLSQDLFGGWLCEWRVSGGARATSRQSGYFHHMAAARAWVRQTYRRLRRSGWKRGSGVRHGTAGAAPEVMPSVCADTLQWGMATGTLPLRDDIRGMVEAVGLAFHCRGGGRRDSDSLSLFETTGPSVEEDIRQRSVALLAGLLSHALDGQRVATDIANRAQRQIASEDAYVRLIPKSQYNYLHYALDDFVRPDRRLGRVALNIMKQGVWTVGELVCLNEAAVFALMRNNRDDLDRLKLCLAEQGLALNARLPGFYQHNVRRRAHLAVTASIMD